MDYAQRKLDGVSPYRKLTAITTQVFLRLGKQTPRFQSVIHFIEHQQWNLSILAHVQVQDITTYLWKEHNQDIPPTCGKNITRIYHLLVERT
jgi:hypothetical protein